MRFVAMPETRRDARERHKEVYLDGQARRPHSHTRSLRRSLEEEGTSANGICAQCDPVLSRHVSDFKDMVHRGSELKRRKRINPHPKRVDITHYRDIVRQNEWLRSMIVLETTCAAALVSGWHLVSPKLD